MSSSAANKNTRSKAANKDNTSKDSTSNKATDTNTAEELHEERIERILEKCKWTWAPHTDFDLDCKWVKLDGVEGYSVQIRKRYDDRVGAQELWTMAKQTEEEAWVNMEQMLNQKTA